MNHLLIAPLTLPALVASLILLVMRRRHLRLARLVSLGACMTWVVLGAALTARASSGDIATYALGNWAAPFGILLVLDRLSAMMVLLTAILSLAVLAYATSSDLDRRGWHFHPLFHFQILGLNGAFLTGDLFNLFVFFEMLLIASYGLMLHGQGAARLKGGVQYVVINLAGSTLFLVAVGILYGVTGTLNMADMAIRVAGAPPADQGLMRAGALLLIAVFALKAALVPLHFWLPRTYASTSAPVAALFAIMTKVGAYSIIRTTILIFGADAGESAWAPAAWMLPAALLTLALGFIGVLAARNLRDLAAFAVVGSMGTLLSATSVFQPAAITAALYYTLHSTLAGAALFLTVDLIARRRGDYGDALTPSPRFPQIELLSVFFFLSAIALVGLPPLSGFLGKLMILNGVRESASAPWIWACILSTTVLALLGFARAGSLLFWESAAVGTDIHAKVPPHPILTLVGAAAPLAGLIALTVFAGPVTTYLTAATEQLFDSAAYVTAVLGPR
ncbi:monovalent cation/H+ antiporter subunit D [Chondromyces crocatus]|uniref:Cation:proton antiporter n=1 Tax=Chondromyces crocatus TaxID=52 RepID=A0A0K1EAH3_CHOCO|nr:monovalent cation/H+ antiporter subunit D [Chondromyces crocatus]AKT37672.1 cation:proton antiporter [Chondromyces crocatus]